MKLQYFAEGTVLCKYSRRNGAKFKRSSVFTQVVDVAWQQTDFHAPWTVDRWRRTDAEDELNVTSSWFRGQIHYFKRKNVSVPPKERRKLNLIAFYFSNFISSKIKKNLISLFWTLPSGFIFYLFFFFNGFAYCVDVNCLRRWAALDSTIRTL